jgi:lipopolysaccharide transport system ATP-binding protein
MADVMVRVDGVGKKFCRTLKRSLWYGVQDFGADLIGARRNRGRLRAGEFWALSDVSLEVRRGESLGLIGRNGAGKTTLLRLMNGLMKPDLGRIEVRGNLQALISLGAGFNPVLTGRENIYVNAAVLGIPKSEIDRKLDEIVAFSGIEAFLDMPVQNYSSGMAVRLGFSVAVHLEPDILLVDEVLAVGDIPFRAKCHRKLAELKQKGIPWILVSHDMGVIRNQTSRSIFLEGGRIAYLGRTDEAISRYLYSISEKEMAAAPEAADLDEAMARHAGREVEITGVALLDANGETRDVFRTGEPLTVRVDYRARTPLDGPHFGVYIFGSDGQCVTGANTNLDHFEIGGISGAGSITFEIEALPLQSGIYRVRADLWDRHMAMVDKVNEGAYLNVQGGAQGLGLFHTQHAWRIEPRRADEPAVSALQGRGR